MEDTNLIEALIRHLMQYNGRKEFTETEIREIVLILELLSIIDPLGKYSPTDFEIGFDHSGTGKYKNILPFKRPVDF